MGLKPTQLLQIMAMLSGCTVDYSLPRQDEAISPPCEHEREVFAVDEVSQLRSPFAISRGRDGVVLWHEPDGVPWRVTRVWVLALLPTRHPETYDLEADPLVVEVYPSGDPSRSEPWRLEQSLQIAEQEWSGVSTDSGYHSAAWWAFDFGALIPADAMPAGEYFVAVGWGPHAMPLLGYSNYELPCEQNWTDPGGSGWRYNALEHPGDDCSWPMLRVETQSIRSGVGCDSDLSE